MNCFYVCACVAFNIPLHQPNDIEINTNNNKRKRSEFINLPSNLEKTVHHPDGSSHPLA